MKIKLIKKYASISLLGLSVFYNGVLSLAETPNYYIEPKSYGTKRETDPPRYVRNLSKTGIEKYKDITWLDVGFENRTRYEYRDKDLRRNVITLDQPILNRTRAYLGIKEILDPLRAVVEFQDSRVNNSKFDRDDRDVNEFDLLQIYGELFFKDALGEEKPFRVRLGRQAFEFLDRRLIARNEWRNTTNNFEGLYATLGQEKNNYQLDILALQPVRRILNGYDERIENTWFYGGIGHIRQWGDIITLEPYYLGLHQDESFTLPNRLINSYGLRGYGIIGKTGFDYDFNVVVQKGTDNRRETDALGYTTEVGYSLDYVWKPRISLNYGYGSGDENPTDLSNERFERFYGFARPWSNNDYFQWENLHAPKFRVEVTPDEKTRVDFGYNGYWLASDKDRWNIANVRDTTGNSGNFLGHEFDFRHRYAFNSRVATNIGYGVFTPGEFTKKTKSQDTSQFFYFELSLYLFDDKK
ncbi:MAG: alginate export family protein [Rickettsiales bacterium]|nr:alginate export family protein [Rickettsiales bacterium]